MPPISRARITFPILRLHTISTLPVKSLREDSGGKSTSLGYKVPLKLLLESQVLVTAAPLDTSKAPSPIHT